MNETTWSKTVELETGENSNVLACAVLSQRLRPFALLLSAAALFVACPNVNADTSVSVGWKDLTFTLEDLDTTDGITPWLHATWYALSLVSADGPPSCCSSGPVPADFRLPSSFEDRGYVSFFSSPAPRFATWIHSLSFEMSADTRLTIAGSLFAESSGPADFWEQVDTDVYWVFHTGGSGYSSARLGSELAFIDSVSGRSEKSFAFVVETSTNASPTYTVNLTSTSNPYAYRTIVNVPEPETYALMLAGLGVCGFVARRRKGATGLT